MSAPNAVVQEIEREYLREAPLPKFRPGDTVKVWARIREGQKTRLQAFEGVCIRVTGGQSRGSFTVRKISYGVGVERVFPMNSPNVEKIEVQARGRVRRAKLYYLRGRSGKKARIRERTFDKSTIDTAAKKPRGSRKKKKEAAAASAAE